MNCQQDVDGRPGEAPPSEPSLPRVETPDYAAMMRRMLNAWGRRLADGDEPDLTEFVAYMQDAELTLQHAVDRLRSERGWSWTNIGRSLGISRQAAQQRFGRDR